MFDDECGRGILVAVLAASGLGGGREAAVNLVGASVLRCGTSKALASPKLGRGRELLGSGPVRALSKCRFKDALRQQHPC